MSLRFSFVHAVIVVVVAAPSLLAQSNVWRQCTTPWGGAVTSMAANDSIIFAGTVGGMMMSTDHGDTWSVKNIFAGTDTIVTLALNGTTIFAGTSGGLVYRSTDNGASWSTHCNGLACTAVHSLAINGTTVFAGTLHGDTSKASLFRSLDNGETWTLQDSGFANHRSEIVAVLGNVIFAGSDGYAIYRSTNNGNTWIAASFPGVAVTAHAFFNVGTTIFAGTPEYLNWPSSLFRSTNGGDYWTTYGTFGSLDINQLAMLGSTMFAATSRGVYSSTDTGNTWTLSLAKSPNGNYSALTIQGGNIFAAGDGGFVCRSTDTGHTWVVENFDLRQVEVIALVAFDNIVVVGTPTGVFRSYDKGLTWQQGNSLLSGAYINALAYNGSAIIAGVDRGFFVSFDSARTWERRGSVLMDTADIRPVCSVGSAIFVGHSGTIADTLYHSTDNGFTWTMLNSGLPVGSISAIVSNGTAIFLGKGGVSCGVFRSTDMGETWQRKNAGMSDSIVLPIAVTGEDVYAGVYKDTKFGGVWHSSDNGETWNQQDDSLPENLIVTLATINGKIFAGTQRSLDCLTPPSDIWVRTDSGLPKPQMNVRAITSSGNTIFAGTSHGVFTNNLGPSDIHEQPMLMSPLLVTCYPNPFSASTTLTYDLSESANVKISVVDAMGHEIAVPVNGAQTAGKHHATFDGRGLRSGAFFYRVAAGVIVRVGEVVVSH